MIVTDPALSPVTRAVAVPVETTLATEGLLLVHVAVLLIAEPFELLTVSVRLWPIRIVGLAGVTTSPCGDCAGARSASFPTFGEAAVGISPQLARSTAAHNDSPLARTVRENTRSVMGQGRGVGVTRKRANFLQVQCQLCAARIYISRMTRPLFVRNASRVPVMSRAYGVRV